MTKLTDRHITPSKAIWDYYGRSLCSNGITIGLIISSIADVIAGYHISYSATELLKDLGYLNITNGKKTINKNGRLVLAHELHERYHKQLETYHVIVNPYDNISVLKRGNKE